MEGKTQGEINELNNNYATPEDVIIYTDRSVSRGTRSKWGFAAYCGSKTLKVMAEAYTNICLSMQMKTGHHTNGY